MIRVFLVLIVHLVSDCTHLTQCPKLLVRIRATLVIRSGFVFFALTPPTAILLGAFAISAFLIGNKISELDNQFKFTEPMKKEIERLVDENQSL
ncbi:hypothetical protein DC909_24725 [Vibrio parahaemolyticus]|nr:hypothetical protein [Vibrio parahaemolyticus]